MASETIDPPMKISDTQVRLYSLRLNFLNKINVTRYYLILSRSRSKVKVTG